MSTKHNCTQRIDLSIVVPVYNEEAAVSLFIDAINRVFDQDTHSKSELIFVNDGSSDGTLNTLLKYQKKDHRIRVVDFTRNFGKESALSAGLKVSRGEAVVPIDVDLQDPPALIHEMLDKWREGYDVVLAKRTNRNSDSLPKRISASWFYRIHNLIAEPKIHENVGDFRLMDRIVVDALNDLPESRRFMKGLFSWVGFNTVIIEYSRPKRSAGSTKFNGWKLWNFALEGVTSFSTAPLRIWTYIGGIVSLFSLVFAFFIALKVILYGVDLPGYASIMVAVTFLGGLQLIGIGILGEYLGRTYLESKHRPPYLIRHIYEQKE